MDLHEAASEKLRNSFGHKMLQNLNKGIIREIFEQDEKINFIVEFQFKDSSAFAFYFSVDKEKIKQGVCYGNLL